jgi:trans-aconitate 2-methyltransferase
MTDPWNPDQYDRFREERMEPLYDLLALIRPQPEMSIVDLGCGTGEITLRIVNHFAWSRAIGIDSSQAMLDRAPEDPRLTFRREAIEDLKSVEPYDVVFSNAALQWVPDNAAVLKRITGTMRDGAQIAVQVPRNEEHPSHRVATEIATTPPFDRWLDGYVRRTHALSAEEYARLLHVYGCMKPVVMERIYVHVLPHAADVVEWVKGTLLTPYMARLEPGQQNEFIEAYRSRLLGLLGNESPYVYPFRRLLFWGRKRC